MTIEMLFNPLPVTRDWSFIPPAFTAYGAQHLITLGVITFLCVLVVWFGKKGKSTERVWLGRLIGLLIVGYIVVFYARQAVLNAWSWEYSLPLELCNIVLVACLISIFRPDPLVSEIAYFWGLGGGLQALATPDLGLGFPSWDFLFFFWGHGATVLAIVFLIACHNFRPRRGSVLRIMIALNVYGLAVGVIDAISGWNYGYLCRKPSVPSLLDFLGPWPWYLLSIELIAFLSFFLLDTPWRLLIWLRKRKAAGGGSSPEGC